MAAMYPLCNGYCFGLGQILRGRFYTGIGWSARCVKNDVMKGLFTLTVKGLSVTSYLKIGCFTFFVTYSCYLMPNAFSVASFMPLGRLFAFWNAFSAELVRDPITPSVVPGL